MNGYLSQAAEANEQAALGKYYDAVSDAQSHLHKWHNKRGKHRETENKMVDQCKHAKKQHKMYAHLLEELKEVTADPTCSIQREWDEDTAQRNGGKQR